ncbi:retrotransposon protein, putative, ty1-copia subclass [Tanacetum coccineum]
MTCLEWRNRTLLDMVRSMMNLTTLPLSFWDYALESATRILNMVPTKKGCEALVKRDTPDKLQQRSVKCIFIGYPKETMGYYFYFPPENKIVVARYAEFFEKNLITQEVSGRAIDLKEIQDEDTSPSEITSEIPMEVEGFEPPQEEVIPVRRSERTHRAPNRLCLNVEAEEHSLGDLNEPTSYKAAMLDSESNKKVCKLQRSIYGLKQASRAGYKRFDEESIDLGKAAFILGIKIYKDRSKRLIGLSQNAYMDKILKRYKMDILKHGHIPMQKRNSLEQIQKIWYQSHIIENKVETLTITTFLFPSKKVLRAAISSEMKQGRSSSSTSSLPQAFEIGESSRKTSIERHEEQIEEILNHAVARMPPKRTSTSEAPAMTQSAIRLVVIVSTCGLLCAEENKVTFATGTLTDDALSWWNAYAQPMGVEQANQITWTELKRLLTNKYCPRTEIRKMKEELYNLTVKGNDLKPYVRRFQELTILCPNMVQTPRNSWKLSSGDYLKALKEIRTFNNNNNSRSNNNYRNTNTNNRYNNHQLQQNRRQEAVRAYAVTPSGNNRMRNKKPATVVINSSDKYLSYLLEKMGIYKSVRKGQTSMPREEHTSLRDKMLIKHTKLGHGDEKRLEDIPVVKEFPDVFSENLPGLPPVRQVEFQTDLIPGAAPVAQTPYRLAPSEMQELSNQTSRN